MTFNAASDILFVLFGMILVGLFGGERREVIKQSVVFIPLWAIVIGLLVNVFNIHYGYVVESTLTYLSQATIPLIMMSLGLTLDFTEIRHVMGDSLFVSFVKLILSPIIMFSVLSLINFGGLGFQVAVLEAGMSTAMNALVLSINYDLDIKLMSSVIFANTVLGLVTLTGLISFLI